MHFEMMNIEMIQMAFHFVEVNMKKKSLAYWQKCSAQKDNRQFSYNHLA